MYSCFSNPGLRTEACNGPVNRKKKRKVLQSELTIIFILLFKIIGSRCLIFISLRIDVLFLFSEIIHAETSLTNSARQVSH